jgi:hypothetical protein
VIDSVEGQYQVKLREFKQGIPEITTYNYEADLGAKRSIRIRKNFSYPRGSPSDLEGDGSFLTIFDNGLIQQNRAIQAKAEAERNEMLRRNNPLPKY